MIDDTIAAIATPLGEGGLAIIRLSGPQALEIADRCFVRAGRNAAKPSSVPTHTLHLGHIVRNSQTVDEVLLAVMRAPRTFTREDVVEVSCHGGLLSAKLVLDTVPNHVGPEHPWADDEPDSDWLHGTRATRVRCPPAATDQLLRATRSSLSSTARLKPLP